MWTSRSLAALGGTSGRPAAGTAIRQHLDLVLELAAVQVKLRDQSSVLGFGWSFLHPLILLLLLFTIFSRRIGSGIEHYGIFLLVGIVHFTHFSNSTVSAGSALSTMRHLTRDTIFPKLLLVVASVIARCVEFGVAMLVCVVIAAVAGVAITPAVVLLPVVMLMQVWTVLWLSLLLSCAFVFVKDTGHLHQVFLRILFFATPVFYSLDFLQDPTAQSLLLLNPLAHYIQWSRALILGGELFAASPVLAMVAFNTLATGVGVLVFLRSEPSFAERI